ncbi:MAG: adenylyl-sulfate kinase [Rhizobacter sp.]
MTPSPPFEVFTLWLTGLSGAGKTTLANALKHALTERGQTVLHLDGDELRRGPHSDLGFSDQDKQENIRRTGVLALQAHERGTSVLVSLISPWRAGRDALRQDYARRGWRFIEIHVDTPLVQCAEVDSKGLYARARDGKLKGLAGVDSVYEEPLNPALRLSPFRTPLQDCVHQVMACIMSK